jgi:hypothetical protein
VGVTIYQAVMRSDQPTPSGADGGEVMASVDDAGTEQRLVIADISAEGEWVSMSTIDTVPLSQWR